MAKYLVKRVAIGFLTVVILMTLTFFLMRIMPGSPFASENPLPPQVQAAFEARYNLHKPLFHQYLDYMGNAFRGDLGESFKKTGVTINSMIASGAPVTIRVGGSAFLFAMATGIFLGITSALSKSRLLGGFVQVVSTLGVSLPSFIVALLLMIVFGVWLGWLPFVGLATPKHYILPAIALALYPIAYISKLVRSNLSEVMRQDYIRMAKAKGLSKSKVILRHALKNAMLPVVTYTGPLIAFLMTGSFVIESIFSIPGIGMEFVKSITNRDYAAIMGLTIYMGSLIVVCNIICDFVCALIDPRVKLGS
ncbi:MAG: ABC transporter permease [Clostridiales bacterium]|nr:ABC transporter permease [Clostridiales bacterium]